MTRWALAAAVGVSAAIAVAPPAAAEQAAFTSPSGNIGCYMDLWHVRCDIRARNWSPPPRPTNCPEFGDQGQDYGQGIVLNADDDAGASIVCANDSVLGAGTVLPYGEETQLDSIRCQMSPAGVACEDFMNGKGFFMSRDGYQIY